MTLLHLVPTALRWARGKKNTGESGERIMQLRREGLFVVNARWDARAVIIKSTNPYEQGASI